MKAISIFIFLYFILYYSVPGQTDTLTCETCKKILEQRLQFDSSFTEALKIADKCTIIYTMKNGMYDSAYARSLYQIGEINFSITQHRKARQYFKLAMAIREKVNGKKSEACAQSLNSIGSLNFVIGRYRKARKYYKQALEIREKVSGKDQSNYASTLNNIGACYYAKVKYDRALKYFQQALTIREKALGIKR
ncbi:MAG: tetratricopeptide repeat protein [Bacteroidia bacterium]